ncbi:unnamed protein product, partial [Brenthis ino]
MAANSNDQNKNSFNKQIRFLQSNLDRSYNSTHEYLQYFTANKYDIGLIAEPYTSNTGSIKTTPGINTYQFNTTGRVKAAVLVRADLGATVGITNYSSSNLSIIYLSSKKFNLYIVSIYIEPKTDADGTLDKLDLFLKHHPHSKVVIGGDFNGWHQQWGSIKNNKRGNDIMRLIASNDLTLSNTGSAPTFEAVTHGTLRTSIIDLTITTANIADLIHSWAVNPDACITSQHNAIDFIIELRSNKIIKRKKQSTFKYTTKNADWDKFNTELKQLVSPETGAHTRKILPTTDAIAQLNQAIKPSFHLTQFLTGHGFHLQYLHKFKIKTTDKCPCNNDDIQSIDHILKHCPKYMNPRHTHESICRENSTDPYDLVRVIKNPACLQSFLKFVEIIFTTLKEYNKDVH